MDELKELLNRFLCDGRNTFSHLSPVSPRWLGLLVPRPSRSFLANVAKGPGLDCIAYIKWLGFELWKDPNGSDAR